MVIDSSALIAILFDEADADLFARTISDREGHISVSNVHETEVVILRRLGPGKVGRVRELLNRAGATLHAFDDTQALAAYLAYERFGKGRHPARLGLMDCAAYALAKSLNAPLLYKGDDFARTDVASAIIGG